MTTTPVKNIKITQKGGRVRIAVKPSFRSVSDRIGQQKKADREESAWRKQIMKRFEEVQ